MEQNLGEQERRIRLGVGVVFGAVAAYTYIAAGRTMLAVVLALAALGFVANYVTCFCGTKKAVNTVVKRLRSR